MQRKADAATALIMAAEAPRSNARNADGKEYKSVAGRAKTGDSDTARNRTKLVEVQIIQSLNSALFIIDLPCFSHGIHIKKREG
jgi:hypothetical protein